MEANYRTPTELQAQAMGIGNPTLGDVREELQSLTARIEAVAREVREAREEYRQRRAAAQGLRIEPDTDERI